MLEKNQKKQFQEYYYQKFGEAYDLNDPAFPFFYEIYEASQSKGVSIRTPEAAQALQAEKNKLRMVYALAACAAVGLICLTFYITRPHNIYSNFIENAEVLYSPDGEKRYLRLKESEDGVIGKNYFKQGEDIIIPLYKTEGK